jgi:hypothetical protein
MARAIDSSLAAVPQPGWVTFVDLTGARIRLRTRGPAGRGTRVLPLAQAGAEGGPLVGRGGVIAERTDWEGSAPPCRPFRRPGLSRRARDGRQQSPG